MSEVPDVPRPAAFSRRRVLGLGGRRRGPGGALDGRRLLGGQRLRRRRRHRQARRPAGRGHPRRQDRDRCARGDPGGPRGRGGHGAAVPGAAAGPVALTAHARGARALARERRPAQRRRAARPGRRTPCHRVAPRRWRGSPRPSRSCTVCSAASPSPPRAATSLGCWPACPPPCPRTSPPSPPPPTGRADDPGPGAAEGARGRARGRLPLRRARLAHLRVAPADAVRRADAGLRGPPRPARRPHRAGQRHRPGPGRVPRRLPGPGAGRHPGTGHRGGPHDRGAAHPYLRRARRQHLRPRPRLGRRRPRPLGAARPVVRLPADRLPRTPADPGRPSRVDA